MMSNVPLYSFRLNRFRSIELAKWSDHKEPDEVYTITSEGKGMCNCQGSRRTPYCKHKQLIEKAFAFAKAQNLTLWGSFYDYDNDILYCPEDNEGIPLNGVIDILGEMKHG